MSEIVEYDIIADYCLETSPELVDKIVHEMSLAIMNIAEKYGANLNGGICHEEFFDVSEVYHLPESKL